MRKNIVPLGMMAVGIFIIGVGVGVNISKCAMKQRGVIL